MTHEQYDAANEILDEIQYYEMLDALFQNAEQNGHALATIRNNLPITVINSIGIHKNDVIAFRDFIGRRKEELMKEFEAI